MPSPEFEQLAATIRATRPPPGTPVPPPELRRAFLDELGALSPVVEGTRVEPLEVGDRPAEWLTPPGPEIRSFVLYLHGGAYTAGSTRSHRGLASRVAAVASARTLVLEYRLSPEHPFPAAMEDAVAAYEWLLGVAGGADRVAIVGDSAGGGLTIAVLLDARDVGRPMPAAAVCLSPWFDLTMSCESVQTIAERDLILDPGSLGFAIDEYLAGADPRDPRVSARFADCAGFPPLYLQVGGDEILVDETAEVAERAPRWRCRGHARRRSRDVPCLPRCPRPARGRRRARARRGVPPNPPRALRVVRPLIISGPVR